MSFEIYPLAAEIERVTPKPFDRGNRPRDHLYASELGSCARAVFFNWRFPRPFDAEFRNGRGALGHAVENLLAEQWRRILVAREVSFRDTLVSGRVDFVIELDGKQIPVELKTSAMRLDGLSKNPMRAHVLQAAFYLSQMPDAPYALLVYYGLAQGEIARWFALKISRSDALTSELNTRIGMLNHLTLGDEPPPCENPHDCFDCSHSAERNIEIARAIVKADLEKP